MARPSVLRPAKQDIRFYLRRLSDEQLRDVADNTLRNMDSILRLNEAIQSEICKRGEVTQPSNSS